MKFVYIHRRKDNNQIFYVGKGSRTRHRTAHGRSKRWLAIVDEAGGFIPEVVFDFLTEKQAYELEEELISYYKENIVNFQSKSNWKDYSKIDWSKHFKYDENSESKLSKLDGKAVGWKNSGYWNISLNKISYRIHRVIWLLFNNQLNTEDIINHIDCNSLNNHIDNLELVNHRQNSLRSKRSKGLLNTNNSSGYTNIFREKYTRSDGAEIDSICALVFDEVEKTKKFRVTINNRNIEEATLIALEWQEKTKKGLDFISPKRLVKKNKTGIRYVFRIVVTKRGYTYDLVICMPPEL